MVKASSQLTPTPEAPSLGAILVTGGSGFIGSNFIRTLLAQSGHYEVVNLDKLSYGSNPANLKELESRKNYRFIKGDICDRELIRKITAEVEIVINFAAETHVDRSISNPEPFLQTNTLGVLNLLEACRSNNLRFIQVSTDEVYGSSPNGQGFKETDRLETSSPYSASKASADMLVQAYHKTYGLEAVITRCTNNYGPYQFPEKLIPKTTIRAHRNLKIPIYGSGHQIRDWIHVKDHCEAVELVMSRGRAGEIYNIAGGNQIENLQVAETILKILAKPLSLIERVDDRPGHDFRYRLDSSKIRQELGWKPTRSFEEGLRETVKWYLENESWWTPITNDKILSPTPWKEQW
jgi:dTDP-glucose 4,6-dehydratase